MSWTEPILCQTAHKTKRLWDTIKRVLNYSLQPDARRFCLFHTAASEGCDLSQTNHFHSDSVCTLKCQRLIGLHLRVKKQHREDKVQWGWTDGGGGEQMGWEGKMWTTPQIIEVLLRRQTATVWFFFLSHTHCLFVHLFLKGYLKLQITWFTVMFLSYLWVHNSLIWSFPATQLFWSAVSIIPADEQRDFTVLEISRWQE